MAEASARTGRCGGLLLAAGGSTRLGRPKQLVDLGSGPLVGVAARALLGSGAERVCAVLGSHAPAVRAALGGLPLLLVENPSWPSGMASSLVVGLRALLDEDADMAAVAIAACDQPALTAPMLAGLIERHRGTGTPAAARYGGRLAIPAVFGRAQFGALLALAGDAGARHLLNAPGAKVEAVDIPSLEHDIDEPGDLARPPV